MLTLKITQVLTLAALLTAGCDDMDSNADDASSSDTGDMSETRDTAANGCQLDCDELNRAEPDVGSCNLGCGACLEGYDGGPFGLCCRTGATTNLTGDHCFDCPGDGDCSGNGTCIGESFSAVCECNAGFSGDDCSAQAETEPGANGCQLSCDELNRAEPDVGSCNLGCGACLEGYDGGPYGLCCRPGATTNLTGDYCFDCPGDGDCSGNGTCIGESFSAVCECNAGFTGDDCSAQAE
jgi:hypothetical protein